MKRKAEISTIQLEGDLNESRRLMNVMMDDFTSDFTLSPISRSKLQCFVEHLKSLILSKDTHIAESEVCYFFYIKFALK